MPYFDWNATTPLLPEARDAWLEATERHWANPSTPYRMGQQALLALDEARERVARAFGVKSAQVVFTSGATEGNNGLLRAAAERFGPDGAIWISAVEHPSVRDSAQSYWGEERIWQIPATAAGLVDLDLLKDRLKKRPPAVVAVMAVNNETGVRQPISEILQMCRQHGVVVFCDAVQWVGKGLEPENLPVLCDAIVSSGHKFGGPKGTGIVILGDEWSGTRFQFGGAQENASRAGTENLPGILAMVKALEVRMTARGGEDRAEPRDWFEGELKKRWPGEVVVHGAAAPRTWNTSFIGFPVHRATRWINRLDRMGFQVSSGSACSSNRAGYSKVLQAMGVDADLGGRTLRISSGWETARSDWEALLAAIVEVRGLLDSEGPSSGPATVIEF